MYQSGKAQTSPTLTSSDSISRCRAEYLIDEITSNAVTRFQKSKASASLPLHQAQRATIAEYRLETLGVIIQLSQCLVKWKDDTQKGAGCHALTMGVKYIKMKKKVQANGQRTLRSGSRVKRQREKSRIGLQHRIQPLRQAGPRSPISHTFPKASCLFV